MIVEGALAMMLYRGKSRLDEDGMITIELPRFVEECDETSATVQVTMIHGNNGAPLSVTEVEGESFMVYGAPGQHFFWRVEATRRDAPTTRV